MAAPYFGNTLGLTLDGWEGVSGALSAMSGLAAVVVVVSGLVSFFCILLLSSAFSWVVGGTDVGAAGAGAGADAVDAGAGDAVVVVFDCEGCCGCCCCCCPGRRDTLGTWPSFPANQSWPVTPGSIDNHKHTCLMALHNNLPSPLVSGYKSPWKSMYC